MRARWPLKARAFMAKTRTVWLVREDAQAPEATKPQVFIETTATGKVTYGVRVSGRTLKAARLMAEAEFMALKGNLNKALADYLTAFQKEKEGEA